jgi:iron complex outermembrane recepter protein
VDDLTFRVSYAKAFLPPTAEQLLPNPTPLTSTVDITDPLTGETYGVRRSRGGNPNLSPQTARDWDLGVIFEPQEEFLKGLRIDLEYYKITQPNYITRPTVQLVVGSPQYASRVTRDPVSGRITVVDISYVNALEYKTNGWDLTINYRKATPFGILGLHALATFAAHDQRQYAIGGPFADYAGYPNDGGEAKLKANATFTWEYGHWRIGWTTTYFGNYYQTGAPGSPSALQGGGPDPYYTDAQGGYTIPSQAYHEIFGSYSSGKTPVGLLSNITIQLGVKNVFNKLPPFDAYYSPYLNYSPYGDARLRDYWISFSKSF